MAYRVTEAAQLPGAEKAQTRYTVLNWPTSSPSTRPRESEYDTIVLLISKGFANMLYRNLLYTAISRARKRVVIVGDPDALATALQRKAPPRRSMLVSKTHSAQEFAA